MAVDYGEPMVITAELVEALNASPFVKREGGKLTYKEIAVVIDMGDDDDLLNSNPPDDIIIWRP